VGLFPHDLAREVLTVDLRWRNLIGTPNSTDARIYYTTRYNKPTVKSSIKIIRLYSSIA